MRILVLAEEVPATSGMPGSPRLFNLCRELARRHELRLIVLDHSSDRRARFDADPTTQGVIDRIITLPARSPSSFWNNQRHRLHLETYFSTRFRDQEFDRAARATVQREGLWADFIFADRLVAAQYLDASSGKPALIDLHDCLSLLFDRMAEQESRLSRRFLLRLEAWSIARTERALGRQFRKILVNSPVDEAALRRISPEAPIATIPNGVDTEFFDPGSANGEASRLVFTGVMGYGPNEDAACHFVQDIFPRIRAEQPSAEFWIVGHEPSATVRRLAENPGVVVTGSVDDVRPYLQSACAFVCPLRYGSGIKNKILAAMSTARPVVATPISLDGIDAKPDREVLLAADAEQFAKQALKLIRDPALAQDLGRAGRELVLGQYSWSARAEQLDQLIEDSVTTTSTS